MKTSILATTACTLPLLIAPLYASGAFYGDPPDNNHPWTVHDGNRPQPPRVEPATFSTQENPGKPPSDAVILFDGSKAAINNWLSDTQPPEATKWENKDGSLQCVPGSGYIRSKEEFGDCQLHIEWSAPAQVQGDGQGRGNSGVFLMGEIEVQVLDNYNNPAYADGFAGSVYGVNPPLVNALNKPGEWQVFDIVFRRPVYQNGKLLDSGYLTVHCNGVLIQDHTPLEGGGGHKSRTKDRPYPEKGPLKLQDHGNPVRYRNVWIRPLPKRASEGGDTSVMSREATAAKRATIAKDIREAATKLTGNEKTLHLMESLCYEKDAAVIKQANAMTDEFVAKIKQVPADQLESQKAEIVQLDKALQYLAAHKLAKFAAAGEIRKVMVKQEWDEKK